MSNLADSVSFEKRKKIFKIIVLGDSGVGKTCLAFRFCSGKFPTNTELTIGLDFLVKTVNIDGEPLKLQLWDTAGSEDYRKSMLPQYYRNVHAVVFVYDVTEIESFQNLTHWIGEFKDYYENYSDIPKILVGNKCDCISQKAVNRDVAQKFANTHNMPLIETSASDDREADHVEAIFMTIAQKLKNRQLMRTISPSYAEQPSIKLKANDSKSNDSCCTC